LKYVLVHLLSFSSISADCWHELFRHLNSAAVLLVEARQWHAAHMV
jgi:hypothetical protein